MWSVNLAQRSLTKQASDARHNCMILTAEVARQPVVKRSCIHAMRRGVREDMSADLARALMPGVGVLPFRPSRDFLLLRKLAFKGLKYTPLSGLELECWKAYEGDSLLSLDVRYWGIVLDITGTERLHKSETSLAKQILQKLADGGIEGRIGIAPTIGAAWALSRYSENDVSSVSRHFLQHAISKLPIESLRLEHETTRTLHMLGIYQIQDVQKLPRKALTSRFGAALLQRLDQAYGALDESFHTENAPESYSAKRIFESPLVNREQVKHAAFVLIEKLILQMLEDGKKAGMFRLVVEISRINEKKIYERRELSLHSASEKLGHIISVIEPLIDSLSLCGAVSALFITALQVEHSRGAQYGFSGDENPEIQERLASELIDTLEGKLGPGSVQEASLRHSHIPEHAGNFAPLSNNKVRLDVSAYPDLDRPPLLFSRPEPAQAMSLLPDHPPSRLQWRGQSFRIRRGTGPERIAAEWWEQYADNVMEERDYFKVQDETGRWLWIFRLKTTHEWFVHGVWT